MFSASETSGRVSISVTAIFMGNDLNISLYGGDAPHIGAVALAQPRPSLQNAKQNSSTCSVLTITGHKEDELARALALDLSKKLEVTVCVACGIHLDKISPEEIGLVLAICDRLTAKLLTALQENKMRNRPQSGSRGPGARTARAKKSRAIDGNTLT